MSSSPCYPNPFQIKDWIERHLDGLCPPVGNKLMFGHGTELQVMIVRGPNDRSDFHVEMGEEWFYQWKGDMVLKVLIENRVFKSIIIREGETFLLPVKMPHSPQRMPASFGIVIERQRQDNELDYLRWYCGACEALIYQDQLHCTDLQTQLKPVINRFLALPENRRCRSCHCLNVSPKPVSVLPGSDPDALIPWPYSESYPLPFNLLARIDALGKLGPGRYPIFGNNCQFQVIAYIGMSTGVKWRTTNEVWYLQFRGSVSFDIEPGGRGYIVCDGIMGAARDVIKSTASDGITSVTIREGETFIMPPGSEFTERRSAGSAGIMVESSPSIDMISSIRD
uniref:3-hydroxyanthranilate 3,4-dioxygenase n=1 Tax=Spongospora subterranea TaxID=70186 RepID=A0A0H5QPK5_9EUKA|eukprot:CRZ03286.1 hypothetical protein [Spongospora subterranea]